MVHYNVRSQVFIALLIAVLGSGCALDGEYNPFGFDWALEGDWTVNGQNPSPANCGEIDSVRVVLLDRSTELIVPELVFPCEAGFFQTDEIFAYGSVQTEWQAVDRSGIVLGRSTPESFVVGPPTNLVSLLGVDFQADTLGLLSFSLEYEDLKDGFLVSCDGGGPSRISYELRNAAGAFIDDSKNELCADEIQFADLPFDTYRLSLTGRADGSAFDDWSVVCEIDHLQTATVGTCPVTAALP